MKHKTFPYTNGLLDYQAVLVSDYQGKTEELRRDTLSDVRPKDRLRSNYPTGALFLFLSLFFAFLIVRQSDCSADSVRLDLIAQIETGGHANPAKAVGDDGRSFGKFQISQIALKDYRQLHPRSKLTEKDLFNEAKAAHLATYLLEVRLPQLIRDKGYKADLEAILTAYNCGISCVGKPLPKTTRNYIKKYKQLEGAA